MPLYLIITMIFLGATLVMTVVVYVLITRKSVLQERLEGITPRVEDIIALRSTPAPWQRVLGNLGMKIPLRPQEYWKYTKSVVAAGFRKEMLPAFIGLKVMMMMALPGAYLVFYGIPLEKERMMMLAFTLALAIVGFLLPSFGLMRMVKKRQVNIFHSLPDVLDLMTVCVEAGLSMDAAILRIASEKSFADSPLAKELKLAIKETQAGKPRSEAIRDMAERTMLDDLKSFASMLIQTEKLGTSLAQSLRIHSDSLRTIRRQRAEEAAAKTSIKLLFPLVFLIMPALFVVMLMPAVLRLIKVFSEI